MISISTIAKDAYHKHAFYQWFYETKGINPSIFDDLEIPVITKQDLLEYERIFKLSYAHDVCYFPTKTEMQTSGSLGRPFHYNVDATRNLHYTSMLFDFLIKHISVKGTICLPLSSPLWIKQIFSQLVKGRYQLVYFDFQKQDISELHADILIDISCEALNKLLMQAPRKKELLYMTLALSDEIELGLHRNNVKVIRVYGMTEFGVVGIMNEKRSCYSCKSGDYFEVYSLDDHHFKKSGEGLLVGTHTQMSGGFPLVRYLTNDLVRITNRTIDSFEIKILGRYNSVKIPTVSELSIDCAAIYDSLKQQFQGAQIEILVLSVFNSNVSENQKIILTLIEDNKATSITQSFELSRNIMIYGAGVSKESYYQYFPTFFCPPLILYNERNKPYRMVDSIKKSQYEALITALLSGKQWKF